MNKTVTTNKKYVKKIRSIRFLKKKKYRVFSNKIPCTIFILTWFQTPEAGISIVKRKKNEKEENNWICPKIFYKFICMHQLHNSHLWINDMVKASEE